MADGWGQGEPRAGQRALQSHGWDAAPCGSTEARPPEGGAQGLHQRGNQGSPRGLHPRVERLKGVHLWGGGGGQPRLPLGPSPTGPAVAPSGHEPGWGNRGCPQGLALGATEAPLRARARGATEAPLRACTRGAAGAPLRALPLGPPRLHSGPAPGGPPRRRSGPAPGGQPGGSRGAPQGLALEATEAPLRARARGATEAPLRARARGAAGGQPGGHSGPCPWGHRGSTPGLHPGGHQASTPGLHPGGNPGAPSGPAPRVRGQPGRSKRLHPGPGQGSPGALPPWGVGSQSSRLLLRPRALAPLHTLRDWSPARRSCRRAAAPDVQINQRPPGRRRPQPHRRPYKVATTKATSHPADTHRALVNGARGPWPRTQAHPAPPWTPPRRADAGHPRLPANYSGRTGDSPPRAHHGPTQHPPPPLLGGRGARGLTPGVRPPPHPLTPSPPPRPPRPPVPRVVWPPRGGRRGRPVQGATSRPTSPRPCSRPAPAVPPPGPRRWRLTRWEDGGKIEPATG